MLAFTAGTGALSPRRGPRGAPGAGDPPGDAPVPVAATHLMKLRCTPRARCAPEQSMQRKTP